MSRVSPGFTAAVERATADQLITASEAKGLRRRAYEAVRQTGADSNAVHYGEVFEQLATQPTDTKTTAGYLKNAAMEFRNHQAIMAAAPAVEEAVRAMAQSEEWQGIQLTSPFHSGVWVGNGKTKPQFYVSMLFDDRRYTSGWTYYAEKIATLIATDPALAPFREVVDTIAIQGYGRYEIPVPLVPGDLDVPPIQGSLDVPGVSARMAAVLAAVQARGRVIMPDADAVVYPLEFNTEERPKTLAEAGLYLAGLRNLLPYADHRITRSLLEYGIEETQLLIRVLQATELVREAVEANKDQPPLEGFIVDTAGQVRAGSTGVTIWLNGSDLTLERRSAITRFVQSQPGFAALDVTVNVNRR